jgi:hypothetical protein
MPVKVALAHVRDKKIEVSTRCTPVLHARTPIAAASRAELGGRPVEEA